MPLRPGDTVLGKYRVEHVLGQGGMGAVLAVRHLELGELFAIKIMLPQALGSDGAVDRFVREARAAARLKGEHIAKVFDVGRLDGGMPYILLEHLEGSDLKKLVLRRGPLPCEEAVTYVLQACEAIAESHAQGIVHRDLKPANLFLIRRPNGSPCVKVIDFGISKVASEGGDLTATGALLGSPFYMSPEQFLEPKSVDARTDIWAMGVILYELVTGKLPFDAVGRVLSEEPKPPTSIRPDLPAWVDAVIGRCLRKEPEERFQSIDDLVAALRSPPSLSAGGAPDIALIDTVPQASDPPPQATEVAVDSTLAQSTWGRTGTGPGRRRGRPGRRAGILLGVIALALGGAWLAFRSPGAAPTPAVDSPASDPELSSASIPIAAPASVAAPTPVSPAPSEAAPPPPPIASAAASSPPEPPAAPTPTTRAGASRSGSSKPQAGGASPRSTSTASPAPPAPPAPPPAPPPEPPRPAQQREGVY